MTTTGPQPKIVIPKIAQTRGTAFSRFDESNNSNHIALAGISTIKVLMGCEPTTHQFYQLGLYR
jgi:hypothetical protein